MMTTQEELVDGQNHPLLMDLIIENVFSTIYDTFGQREAMKTFLKCREVCSSWEECARKKIQSLATVSLISSEVVNSGNYCSLKDVQEQELKYYMEYLSSRPLLRFNNFEFIQLSMTDKLTSEFLSMEGPTIERLSLNYEEESVVDVNWTPGLDSETFRQLLVSIGGRLKHLHIQKLPLSLIKQRFRLPDATETLSTHTKIISIVWQDNGSEYFYKDILLSAPSLQSLKIVDIHDRVQEDEEEKFGKFMSILPGIPAVIGNHLKHIEICKTTNPPFLHHMYPLCQLRLVTLSLAGLIIGEDRTEFARFLKPLSETLKYLHLKHFYGVPVTPQTNVVPITFPVLPNLLELTLSIFWGSDGLDEDEELSLDISPINYREIFPKLKKASMFTHMENINSILSEKNNEPHTNLDTLNLEFLLNTGHLKIMRAWHIFPRIKKLEVGQGCYLAYRSIWSLWPQLESLIIDFDIYCYPDPDSAEFLSPDCLFTGLTVDKCKRIRALKDPLEFDCDDGFPSIANLKKLRHLSINMAWGSEDLDLEMSNASIWAIAKLPCLEFIQLPEIHNINEDGIRTLSEVFPAIRIENQE